MPKTEPYRGFRFTVEVDGVEIGGFSQASGFERTTAAEEFREGGVNDFVHRLATNTTYAALTLRRGIAGDDYLWDWHQRVIDGEVERKTVSVVLKDYAHREARRWEFLDAFPIKWSGSDLDAQTGAVVVEAVEFAHHGLRGK